jgi:hypothetical protein
MSKIDRVKIHEKYGGHCSYCGRVITIKEMQVDHLIPKRNRYVEATLNGDPSIKENWDFSKTDGEENLMPSCRRCNHYKRAESLNRYRAMVDTIPERLKDNYIFKVALDYGIIEIKEWDAQFYFEKFNQKLNLPDKDGVTRKHGID